MLARHENKILRWHERQADFNLYMDASGVWFNDNSSMGNNKALSVEEISQLYNGGAGV